MARCRHQWIASTPGFHDGYLVTYSECLLCMRYRREEVATKRARSASKAKRVVVWHDDDFGRYIVRKYAR